jgi:membrane-bound serine protease (ClpP class)
MTDPIFAYALIALGLLLILGEFVLPTGLVLSVLGIAALIVGIAMSFVGNTTRGLVTSVAVFVLIPIVAPLLFKYWPQTALGRRFMPTILELEQLRGRYGKTISALRPSGVSEFDGKRVDTITNGEMIDAGHWVRCIDVKAGRVIVRQVERPPDLEDLLT